MRRAALLASAAIAIAASSACSSSAPPGLAPPDGGPTTDAAPDAAADADSPPVLDDATLRALAALSPATLPAPPPDTSNAFADDARAAALGQRLFFDARFSGALLSPDNDGTPFGLGKKGETGKVACASCHVASAGFSDARSYHREISLGAGWGRRRAPSLLDVGQARLLMWDGRHDALYNQVFGPLESVVEMNSSRLFAAEQAFALYRADYEALFGPMPPLDDGSRFPRIDAATSGCSADDTRPDQVPACTGAVHGVPGDHAEFDGMAAADQDAVTRVVVNMGKAIGAYERRLSCGQGRFDRFMHGDAAALSASEQRGAALFVGKGGCVSCHSGPFLTDQRFHDVGLRPALVVSAFLDANDHGAATGLAAAIADPLSTHGPYADGDDGRLPASVAPEMEGAFRTPGLRCVSSRPSWMHTAQMTRFEDVVAFFSRGGDASGFVGHGELHPLGLDAGEQSDLVAFLRSLDGPGPDATLLAP